MLLQHQIQTIGVGQLVQPPGITFVLNTRMRHNLPMNTGTALAKSTTGIDHMDSPYIVHGLSIVLFDKPIAEVAKSGCG
jgi:hypothetical protein